MKQTRFDNQPVNKPTVLKVNLHVIEACNMHCEFCFAKFKCSRSLSLEEWMMIVDNIVDKKYEGGICDE